MDAHANFSYSTVLTAPSPALTDITLVVQSGDGAKFPTPPFNATVWPKSVLASTVNAEIVRVTAISTDTLTITRHQEGTAARSIIVGDQIAATITAKVITDIETAALQTLFKNAGNPNTVVTGSGAPLCLCYDQTNNVVWFKDDALVTNTGWHA